MPNKSVNRHAHMVGTQLPTERVRDINFAKRLRQLMSEREMTQSQLAAGIWGRHISSEGKHVAKGRDRISVWLSGHNFPDHENLIKLAKALKVKLSELAPLAEQRSAHSVAADWAITKPHGEVGMSFFQAARYVPDDIAHEIFGLLIKADQRQRAEAQKERNTDEQQQQQS